MKYILNAWSFNMLPLPSSGTLAYECPALYEVRQLVAEGGFVSGVGHAETAAVLTNLLGIDVACARVNVQLRPGDVALVAQYSGPRLPEGARELPEGARIVFVLVEVGRE